VCFIAKNLVNSVERIKNTLRFASSPGICFTASFLVMDGTSHLRVLLSGASLSEGMGPRGSAISGDTGLQTGRM
jgi:hypothetical protein